MLFSPKHIVVLLLLISISISSWAQTEKKVRPKESDILLEKLFIEATREKILQNWDEAIRKYLEVLQKDNNNAAANYELSRLYRLQKQLDKAVMRAEKAVELDEANLLYNEQYALVLEESGNFKKAAELYAGLTSKYPDNHKLYYEWAYYLTKSNKAEQAIKVFSALEKRIGTQEGISMRKYKLYMSIGKAKKAEVELDRLIKAFPKEPEYMLRMANFYASTKQFDKAKDWYKKTLVLDPNNPTANVAMVEYFLQNGDTSKYLNALAPIFEDPKQSINAKLNTLEPLAMGLLENRYKNYEKAIFKLSKYLVVAHPDDAKGNLIRGELLFMNKKYQKAIDHYTISIQKDKNNVLLWRRLLECYQMTNNRKELMTQSQEMMDLFPSQPYGYYYSGIAEIAHQKYQKAEVQFLHAIEIAVTDKETQGKALRYLGLTYTLLNSYDKAEKTFKEALQIDPENPDTKQVYAHSLALRGTSLDQASEMIGEALQDNPNHPAYLSTKGLILYKQAKYALAQQELSKALNQGGSTNPETLERYGDTLFKLGKTNEAVNYWQQAVTQGSTSSILKQKIATKQLYE